jgi:hypothetical protein
MVDSTLRLYGWRARTHGSRTDASKRTLVRPNQVFVSNARAGDGWSPACGARSIESCADGNDRSLGPSDGARVSHGVRDRSDEAVPRPTFRLDQWRIAR